MPLAAQDHMDVMDLIASYCLRIDAGDAQGYAENFRPDAELELIGGRRLHGRDEIKTWVGELIGSGRVGGDPASLRHFVGLPQIHGEGDRCTAKTYCVILDYDPEQHIRVPLVGRYDDTCVKVDGRWYFEERIIRGELSARSD